MFSKLAAAFVSVAAVASAMPAATTNNACNVGQSIQAPQSAAAQSQFGLSNLVAGDITSFIGAQCNPISVLGASGTGSNRNANPVCCENNTFNGVVAFGCTPVNVNV